MNRGEKLYILQSGTFPEEEEITDTAAIKLADFFTLDIPEKKKAKFNLPTITTRATIKYQIEDSGSLTLTGLKKTNISFSE